MRSHVSRGFHECEDAIGATPEGARFSSYIKLGGRQAVMAKRFVNEKALASTERYMALADQAGIAFLFAGQVDDQDAIATLQG